MRNFYTSAALASAALLSASAQAEQGDVLIRARAIWVAPTDNASDVLPAFPGGSVEVENAVVPELDFTYFLTNNLGAELILATSPHDLHGAGVLAGLGEVADVMALPPTLTLQYHFNPNGKVRPYAGAGVNYTIFYDEDASSSLIGAVGPTAIDVDDSFGVAFQLGVDFELSDRWFLNADIKYIQIDTTATLTSGGAINTIQVDLDPIVAGIGVGMRF